VIFHFFAGDPETEAAHVFLELGEHLHQISIGFFSYFYNLHKSLDLRPFLKSGLQRQFVGGEAHRFFGLIRADAADLEQDATLLHDTHKVVDRTLAAAHRDLVALGGNRLVGKNPYPNLAAALHVARHRAPRCLDLPACYPAVLQRADPEISKRQVVPGSGDSFGMTAMVLAVFRFFRY